MEASFLLTGSHGAEKYYASYLEKKINSSIIQLQVLPTTSETGLKRPVHCCNSGTNITEAINHFLIGFNFNSTR